MAKDKPPPAESKVVEAVGVAVSSGRTGDKSRAKLVEEAMSAAVAKAYAEGVRDPNEVRARMMRARELVLHPPPAPAAG